MSRLSPHLEILTATKEGAAVPCHMLQSWHLCLEQQSCLGADCQMRQHGQAVDCLEGKIHIIVGDVQGDQLWRKCCKGLQVV